MTQFYYELRVNKRTPLESLREAQLTLYRHPERIGEIGEGIHPWEDQQGRHGDTRLAAATETKPGETAKTTPTKLWAAFVLSGLGK